MKRHRIPFITLLAVLAAGCSGDNNPTAPLDSLKTRGSVAAISTAPPLVLNYSTPYNQSVPIVRSYETDANSMSSELGVSRASSMVQVAPSELSTLGLSANHFNAADGAAPAPRKVRGPVGGPVGNYYPLGCTKDYIDCVYDCLYTRLNFQNALGDFWRADDEYWQHVLTGRDYLNHINGGPQTAMADSYYLMNQYARQWRNGSCSQYVQ